jgi:hypothetical protein
MGFNCGTIVLAGDKAWILTDSTIEGMR